nr:immunoglobulin heavy chain junction region [Macaca mulatta]MOY21148.1 immunoglobulin heavy chain junction region [Macaca mulatta]MOY21275.1 immunoglobulin heavy chain junction region [Macaca mulatta]MOY21383.1 immunoglobulin heavy chain junction region [Macaca mulatta]MOY21400.1 immunoglobulin heavy chain junction region [Macaca mulatta]
CARDLSGSGVYYSGSLGYW